MLHRDFFALLFLYFLVILSLDVTAHTFSPLSGIKPFLAIKPISFRKSLITESEVLDVDVVAKQESTSTKGSGVTTKKKGRNHQIVTFFSGGIAGTIASTLTMPLEVVKTQLQTSSGGNKKALTIFQQILNKDGAGGFFRGLRPMLIGIIPTRAIYFWAYSTSKDAVKQTSIGDSPLNHLISAFAAGITSNTLTNPIWMIKTRFQIIGDHAVGQKIYSRYSEVIHSIWKEEGFHGFFKGLTASYIGCFEGAIQWIVYEKLKNTVLTSSIMNSFQSNSKSPNSNTTPSKPSVLDLFLMAAFSKFTAICLTYPHEVVRTRLREQSINGVFKYKGFFSALQKIAVEEGARGLYSGLGMHLIRSVPNAAIMFVSYEIVSGWLDRQAEKL